MVSNKGPELLQAGRWKAWVVQCIAAADRFGALPIQGNQLHVLLYLANTLAESFDVTAVRGRVLKRGPFPFYPDVQFEIDRLAFSGVLTIDNVDYGRKGQIAADYSLGREAIGICESLMKSSNEMQRLAALFEELVSAALGGFLKAGANIGPIDANYGDDEVLDGEVVDFSEWRQVNYNREVAEYMLLSIKNLDPDRRRDGVQLYCSYLEEALTVDE